MPRVVIRISARQLMLLKLTGITGTIFFGAIRLMTNVAGANGYIAVLIGGTLSWLAIILSTRIGQRFPDQTPFEYAQAIFGKWLGKFFGLAIVTYHLIAASLIIRSLGDFLITAILPTTPLSANIALMLFLICIGTYIGLEGLARFNEGFYPLIFLAWVLVLAASIPKVDLGWFRPLLDIELSRLATASVLSGTLLIDGFIVLVFYPFVTDQKNILKYTSWSVVIGTGLVLALQATVIGVFSTNLAAMLTYPMLHLAQDASLGVFLERIEALYLAVWVVGTFIRVAVVFYIGAIGLTQTLGVKNHRFFIPVLVAPVFYLSFQAANLPVSFNYEGIFNQYGMFMQYSFVILLLAGAVLRGKRGSKHNANSS